jgi:two-component system, NtrC family, sensor kinase
MATMRWGLNNLVRSRPVAPASARAPRPRTSVARRVTLSYLAVTAVFSGVTGWNVLALRTATHEAELLRQGYLPLALSLRDAVLGQDTWISQLNHITTAQNTADKRLWFEGALLLGRPGVFAAVRAALHRAFGSQEAGVRELSERLAAEADAIEAFLERDSDLLAALFAALELRDQEQAQGLRDDLVERSNEGRQRLAALERQVTTNVEALLNQARSRERRAIAILVALSASTVAVGLWVAWRARRLLAPLAAVTRRAEAVAAGDLTPRPVVAGGDEIGQLAATFEGMVTAIGRAHAELLASERLAAIGKMAAQVTHEVRNPLSSLALNVEMLEEELADAPAEAQALLRATKLEIARLGRLTEKYLSLARSRPNFQDEDIGELVRLAVSALEPELRQHQIQVSLRIEDGLPTVQLDESQFRQILLNLMRNAQEAMSGGGQLLVSVHGDLGERVALHVVDTGPGMDDATRRRIFEPFFTTKSHGTGLGLAITREIVEAHGGTIRCEGAVPRGTRFVVELPVSATKSVHAQTGALPPQPNSPDQDESGAFEAVHRPGSHL